MKRIPRLDLDHILDHTEQYWRELAGGRIFLTGCTGFFGIWILEGFLAAERRLGVRFDITLLTRNPDSFLKDHPQFEGENSLHFIQGDIRSFAFPDGSFSHVIHGATTRARETFENEPPLSKFETVAMGTRRVLDFCVDKKSPSLLYLGSGSAYGNQPGGAIQLEEDSPYAPDTLNPEAALGHGKRVAEFFCAAYAKQHSLTIKMTRCFSFLGPYLPLDIHYAVGNFIHDGIEGRAIKIKGDGIAVRSYLYMSDLVIWLLTIFSRGESMRIYNVGSEEAHSILDLAELVSHSFSPAIPIEHSCFQHQSPGTPAANFYIPSTKRARTELGLVQKVSLSEAVKRTIEFYR